MGQIDLFKNYLYAIGTCAKKLQKNVIWNNNKCNFLTSKHKKPSTGWYAVKNNQSTLIFVNNCIHSSAISLVHCENFSSWFLLIKHIFRLLQLLARRNHLRWIFFTYVLIQKINMNKIISINKLVSCIYKFRLMHDLMTNIMSINTFFCTKLRRSTHDQKCYRCCNAGN